MAQQTQPMQASDHAALVADVQGKLAQLVKDIRAIGMDHPDAKISSALLRLVDAVRRDALKASVINQSMLVDQQLKDLEDGAPLPLDPDSSGVTALFPKSTPPDPTAPFLADQPGYGIGNG